MTAAHFNLIQARSELEAAGYPVQIHIHIQGRWMPDAADSLIENGIGFQGASLDSRQVSEGRLFVGLQGNHNDGRDYIGAALRSGAGSALSRMWNGPEADPILSSDPGHDCGVVLTKDPAAALACLAAAYRRRCRAQIIGITGSNGKTTTKDFLAAILSQHGRTTATAGNLNNELGVPLTLLDIAIDDDFAVVEMGASRIEDITGLSRLVTPRTGVITNAGGAHLQGFGTLETIIRTKGELLKALPADGTAILNADSPGFTQWCETASCRILSWGRERGDHRWSWTANDTGGCLLLDQELYTVPLPGLHNGANLVAAILAARSVGVENPDVKAGLADFRASEHRSTLLRIGGIRVIDDSYNANPASMLAAVEMLSQIKTDGQRIAVLGEMAELGPESALLHRETGKSLGKTRLDMLITVGDQAMLIAEGFRTSGGEVRICPDLAAASEELTRYTGKDDIVLVKGSRSASMEKLLDILVQCRNSDPDQI